MVTSPKSPLSLPPLENGDRLTRAEFEQRYQAMPPHKKAELIEGRVFMASPVRARKHGKPHAAIMGWLFTYWQATPGIELMDNPTVRLDNDNEPQPDACLRIEEAIGGQSRVTEDDYIEGAPELIVEIAASSVSYDLHDKKQVYRRHGVQEYLVWRVLDQAFDWFVLQDGAYIDLPVDADGILRSQVFPGLWLAVNDLLAGNLAEVVAVSQRGLESSNYRLFQHSLSTKLNQGA
ncbi:Uma2 family endonuclease [Leptothermofonsia sichuanensis E412]|uniref:Uma2 family endonuclease n=1 Tax=Leptothermofonsia sichuanensis TaxID=2917832 RepID=UPI001CA77D03|nr:Uma2 family endonuclease [Leptothermofonsia sichuanensis]QZZ21885.1 Uma2 family endonuclease [Leptothermofonsia sichuanensis E412]